MSKVKRKYKFGEGDPCPICLNNPADGENERGLIPDDPDAIEDSRGYDIRTLDCGHKFHLNCIGDWLQDSNVCPTCRAPINDGVVFLDTPLRRKNPKRPKYIGDMPNIKWDVYITKVLKKVHPDTGMTKNAKDALNMFINMLGKKIIQRAVDLNHSINKLTLSSKDIQSAVFFEIPGELAKFATSEGNKAITKYYSYTRTRAQKAGIIFPPSRARKLIMGYWRNNIGSGSEIYLAAVLEYICAEILDISGNNARDRKRARIDDRSLFLAIENDYDIRQLSKNIKFEILGGVIPTIHSSLMDAAKKGKK